MSEPTDKSQALLDARKQAIQIAAQEDIADIRALTKETPAFQRYFVRRLKMKRDELAKEIIGGVPAAYYVVLQPQIVMLDEILAMPDTDRAAAHKDLHPEGTPLPED